jgi:peptide/nickel transport system permease protein
MISVIQKSARRLGAFAVFLLGVTTLLFFLLQLTGDPAEVMVGDSGTPEQIEQVRAQYGFDRPLIEQYGRYLLRLAVLDFGTSFANDQPALNLVAERLGPTLLLTLLSIVVTLVLAVPLGAWLGSRPDAGLQQAGGALVYMAQGIPGFVAGLLLIQLFAVQLRWLPSIGHESVAAWILPTLTLASFLVPKLTRVIAANVTEALREDYIRTARANGSGLQSLVWRHALPNALLGATALVGTQFAFLISGAVITEVIFAWPGLGWLLVKSTTTLDFPVIQAAVFVIAVLVFAVNALTDLLFVRIDPRLRGQTA